MLILKGPSDVPGLNLWFDASDASTINNGRISNNEMVFTFTDKIGNVNLRNSTGTGPSYSFGAVNGNNGIYFPIFPLDGIMGVSQYALTASNVQQLAIATCSIFIVLKPTSIFQDDVNGNQKWPLTIWDNSIVQYFSPKNGAIGGFPTRGVRLGESGGVINISRRQNPSMTIMDARQDIIPVVSGPSDGYLQQWTFAEDSLGRAQEKGLTACLNVVTIGDARLQNGLKRAGFTSEKYECLEEVTMPGWVGSTALGFPTPPSPESTNINYFTRATAYRGLNWNGAFIASGANNTANPGLVWNGTAFVAQTAGPHLCIGSYFPLKCNAGAGKYPFVGYFCEFLNYNRMLTDEETASIRNYLQKKWFPK